jgi:hypothetical protein
MIQTNIAAMHPPLAGLWLKREAGERGGQLEEGAHAP